MRQGGEEGEPEVEMSEHDLRELERAVLLLESPGLAARITSFLGAPVEKAFDVLPQNISSSVQSATRKAIEKALSVAIRTLDAEARGPSADTAHRVLSGISGFTGGFFGLPALMIELPVSTTIMLRSIADIARSQGEDLELIRTRLACVEVFAMGGKSSADNSVDAGYYAVRSTLAKAVSEAAQYIAERGLAEEGAPVIVRFIAQIASRFGATVSEKAAAQAIPALGAVGGATINLVFMNHFQDMARGHFTVRRLERTYGEDLVRREYERLREVLQSAG